MALALTQLTVSAASNPPSPDLYKVVEMQGAITFDTPTRTGVRVGDNIAYQELLDYLNSAPASGVLVIVKT
jgi:hypothetical protein